MALAVVIRGVRIFMLRSLFVLLFIPVASLAQFTYKVDQSPPVQIGQKTLSLPWSGGLNSPQVNKIDFDGDGKEDMVIFDRAANKILPYRNVNNSYVFTPDYAPFFPPSVNAWMLLRDFNCDGKKDLFTSDPFGIVVFVNTTKVGQPLSWRPFNPGSPLLTKGFNGNINLKINDVDIPAIDDVDNDGDLDILSMRFVGIGTIEWHKNMSMEVAGKCDSLQLERVTQTYGSVEECNCGVFAYNGQPCSTDGGRVSHVGGKSLLSIDYDNDGKRDLLYSEETCASLYVFRNQGTNQVPVFSGVEVFPQSHPAIFQWFPTPYFEDVDFDGLSDLVVAPNLYARTNGINLVNNSVWFYKNTGTAQAPAFTFVKNNFLQDEMIDLGDYSAPAFIDLDNDGDQDMFVGYYGNQNFRSTLQYFHNTGTASEPSFQLMDDDYGTMSNLFFFNIKPQFVDVNGDDKPDLAFTATSQQDNSTALYFIPNLNDTGFGPGFSGFTRTALQIGFNENVHITDVNRDGKPDVFRGSSLGALQYYENGSNNGMFDQLTLKSGAYLGLNSSTSRQNPSAYVADLDSDGLEDMIVGDQRGNLLFYSDYRTFDPAVSTPLSEIVYNELTEVYEKRNFGGRVRATVVNLFNTTKPAIVIGNTLGGLSILKSDNDQQLSEEPVVTIWNNPLLRGQDLKARVDREGRMQIFSILGQKMNEPVLVPANVDYVLTLKELAAGMYIARFTFAGKGVSVKFIVK